MKKNLLNHIRDYKVSYKCGVKLHDVQKEKVNLKEKRTLTQFSLHSLASQHNTTQHNTIQHNTTQLHSYMSLYALYGSKKWACNLSVSIILENTFTLMFKKNYL